MVTAVVLVILYAVGSGRWVSTGSAWYLSLEQPWWQPPPWVFGLIWPYNFIMLMVAGIVVSRSAPSGRVIAFLALLATTVALAIGWAYLFYGPHELVWAAIALTGAAVLTLPVVGIAFGQALWLGLVLLPYQVWLFLAASLSWGYVAKS
jgi:tryptophan-rich sensory protein